MPNNKIIQLIPTDDLFIHCEDTKAIWYEKVIAVSLYDDGSTGLVGLVDDRFPSELINEGGEFYKECQKYVCSLKEESINASVLNLHDDPFHELKEAFESDIDCGITRNPPKERN